MQFLFPSVALVGARNFTAAVVICLTMTDIGTLLSFNSVANACYSQDSMVWNFTYSPGPSAYSLERLSRSRRRDRFDRGSRLEFQRGLGAGSNRVTGRLCSKFSDPSLQGRTMPSQ